MTVIALVSYWSVDFRGATTGGQCRFGRLIRIYPEYRTGLECNPNVTCLAGCTLKAGAVLLLYIAFSSLKAWFCTLNHEAR